MEQDADGAPTYVEQHRTVGDRIRELVAAGFVVRDLVEPEWPADHERIWGQWSPLRGRLFPGTAIFVADKPPSIKAEEPGRGQWSAESQSRPTPMETSSGTDSG